MDEDTRNAHAAARPGIAGVRPWPNGSGPPPELSTRKGGDDAQI